MKIKCFKRVLWEYIVEEFGGYGKYYTDKDSEGYLSFFADVKKALADEGFNICDRNVAKIIAILNDEGIL